MAVTAMTNSPSRITNDSRSNQDSRVNRQNMQRDVSQNPSSLSYIQLYVTNLPPGTGTSEIYDFFKEFGNVKNIWIVGNHDDGRGLRAEVRFEPPPQTVFWGSEGRPKPMIFKSNNQTTRVHVSLGRQQPRKFTVESPIRKGKTYPLKTEVFGSSLCFGVMLTPRKMMTMTSRGNAKDNVRLVLNLYENQREIEVYFPSIVTSDMRRVVRNFRFAVSLDEKFTIQRLPNNEYILDLAYIPWYSKQLKEHIALTHIPGASRWSEEDTWARQTDVVAHKQDMQTIHRSSLSLQKNINSINVARWTTFKFKLIGTETNIRAEGIFRNALNDFNVNVIDTDNIEIVVAPAQVDTSTWNLINGNSSSTNGLSSVTEHHELAFSVRYQLEVCLSHRWLSEYTITAAFLQQLAATDSVTAVEMLKNLDASQERLYDPMDLFTDLRFRRPKKLTRLPTNCMEVRSATVTATSIIFHTPTVEVTNRIIRKYREHAGRFLRVRFEDDNYRGRYRLYASTTNKMIQLFQRVRRVLRHGIKLGDVHYDFLAWGNSQLREHGVYFFARVGSISATSIRAEMGAFDEERVVAKRAARMGQCFSTTKPVYFRVPTVTKANTIPDIRRGSHIFTDGVGKISELAAALIQNHLNIKGPLPCTFQFRLGGCKGVLVVWPELMGVDVKVRESQFKFDSSSGELEIIRWSEFWQPFLNRQIIICLSDLGVPDDVFLHKQEVAIKALDAAMVDDNSALKALRDNVDPNLMTISMCSLVSAGFRRSKEPFVVALLNLWRAWSLKYLKEKAKIPVSKGAFVLGVADETGILRGHYNVASSSNDQPVEEKVKVVPEIFIQILNPHTGKREVITGVCVLARNPSLHRGDIRVVRAIDVPKLHHLCDVVVMPTTGDRDLPSMCSGGDLDGDDYVVIWDQDLLPSEWNAEPFHYDPPTPRMAADEITTHHIIEFFYDYMQNDYLGRIAHAHLATADSEDDGIKHPACLELVNLHSMAVDYPKTGIPAILERRLEPTRWPHFMEKKSNRTYRSGKVLGRLYDAVERVKFKPNYKVPLDSRVLNFTKPTDTTIQAIKALKHEYDSSLQRIMAQHSIQTEFEVWSTFVLDHSKASRDFKFHEEIGRLSAALKEQFYDGLVELAGGKEFKQLAPIAVAAYHYTNAQIQAGLKEIDEGERYDGPEGMPFISFPWLLQDTLCKIAEHADSTARISEFATFKDGKRTQVDSGVQFDESGRAQIEVVDELDVNFNTSEALANTMPDPYRPEVEDDKIDESDPYQHIELLLSKDKKNISQGQAVTKQVTGTTGVSVPDNEAKPYKDVLIEVEPQEDQVRAFEHIVKEFVVPSYPQKPSQSDQIAFDNGNPIQMKPVQVKVNNNRKAEPNTLISLENDECSDEEGHQTITHTPFAYLREQLVNSSREFGYHRPQSEKPELIRKWIEAIDSDSDSEPRRNGQVGAEPVQHKNFLPREGSYGQNTALDMKSKPNVVDIQNLSKILDKVSSPTDPSPRELSMMGDPLDSVDEQMEAQLADMELKD